MNKQNILIFFLLVLLLSCQQSKRDNFSMEMPDTKEALFAVRAGIPQNLKDEKIVFESYNNFIMLNYDKGKRLYANGDYYEIFTKRIETDSLYWRKIGVISQTGLKKMEEISHTSVVDFIVAGPDPNHTGNEATTYVSWYFYFGEARFVETQSKMFQWKWWIQPRFVGEVNGVLKRYLKHEEIIPGSKRFKKEEACD